MADIHWQPRQRNNCLVAKISIGAQISFAEHSYSTFESCFIINDILKSGIFAIEEIGSPEQYIDLNKSFILFFAYMGRIKDTCIRASDELGYHNGDFKQSLQHFYEARNIVIHGKKVPFAVEQRRLHKNACIADKLCKRQSME